MTQDEKNKLYQSYYLERMKHKMEQQKIKGYEINQEKAIEIIVYLLNCLEAEHMDIVEDTVLDDVFKIYGINLLDYIEDYHKNNMPYYIKKI